MQYFLSEVYCQRTRDDLDRTEFWLSKSPRISLIRGVDAIRCSFPFRSFTLAHIHRNYLHTFSKNGPCNLDILISRTARRPTFTRRQPSSSPQTLYSTLNSNSNSLINDSTTYLRCSGTITFRRAASSRAKFTRAEQHDAFFETTTPSSSSSGSKDYSLETAYAPSISMRRQTAAEGEWLQENEEEVEEAPTVSQVHCSRFDWRGRATSRAKAVVLHDGERTRIKRIRPSVPMDDENDPFLPAIRNYSLK